MNKSMKIEEAISNLVRGHQIAVETLTEKQLVEAIRQAIASGDFQRYVHANSQKVVYTPFREVKILCAKISTLRDRLQTVLDEVDGMHPIMTEDELIDSIESNLREFMWNRSQNPSSSVSEPE